MNNKKTNRPNNNNYGNIETTYSVTGFSARKKQRLELAQVMQEWTKGFNLFLTFKFSQGNLMNHDRALKIYSLFWNKMDRLWYSSPQIKKGLRIPRVSFVQMGSSGSNIHMHALTKPNDALVFKNIAENIWHATDKCTHDLHIEFIRNLDASNLYLAHEFTLRGSDSFLPEHTHISNTNVPPTKSMSQLKRLLKHCN